MLAEDAASGRLKPPEPGRSLHGASVSSIDDTGSGGEKCSWRKVDIESEFYSESRGRVRVRPVIVASSAGGVNIEEAPRKNPERCLAAVDRSGGCSRSRRVRSQARRNSRDGWGAADILVKLYKVFSRCDASSRRSIPSRLTPDGNSPRWTPSST